MKTPISLLMAYRRVLWIIHEWVIQISFVLRDLTCFQGCSDLPRCRGSGVQVLACSGQPRCGQLTRREPACLLLFSRCLSLSRVQVLAEFRAYKYKVSLFEQEVSLTPNPKP